MSWLTVGICLGRGNQVGPCIRLEALDGVPRATAAEAMDDALICAIPRDAFTHYWATHPTVTVELTKLIGLRLRKIQSRVEDLSFGMCRHGLRSYFCNSARATV